LVRNEHLGKSPAVGVHPGKKLWGRKRSAKTQTEKNQPGKIIRRNSMKKNTPQWKEKTPPGSSKTVKGFGGKGGKR